MKEHAFSICLIILAASDTFILHFGFWRWWTNATFTYELRRSDFLCKLHVFLLWFSGDVSSWILCLITIQRFISVWLPTKAKSLCNHKGSIVGCAIVAFLSLMKNGHFLIAEYKSPAISYTYIGGCEPTSATYLHFLVNEWGILDLTMAAILPFTIIAICNGMIIVKLWKAAALKKSQTDTSREKKITSINVMLTMNSMVFLILVMPWYVVVVIYSYANVDASTLQIVNHAYSITLILWYVNPAINFYLYCLGGPMFRRELRALCGQRPRVGVLDATTEGTQLKNY